MSQETIELFLTQQEGDEFICTHRKGVFFNTPLIVPYFQFWDGWGDDCKQSSILIRDTERGLLKYQGQNYVEQNMELLVLCEDKLALARQSANYTSSQHSCCLIIKSMEGIKRLLTCCSLQYCLSSESEFLSSPPLLNVIQTSQPVTWPQVISIRLLCVAAVPHL